MKPSRGRLILTLGLLTTLLVAAAWFSGLGSHLEQRSLDWRFRQGTASSFQDDIIHVDIDDLSIEELGRWPWPRKLIGGIVTTLNNAGADTIALDIVFPEPQELRFVSDALSVYGSFEKVLDEEAPPKAIFDDVELARSIQEANRVTLSMHMDFKILQHAKELDAFLKTNPDKKNREAYFNEHPAQKNLHTFREKHPYEAGISDYLSKNSTASFRECAQAIAEFDPASPTADSIQDSFEMDYLRVRSRLAIKNYQLGHLNAPTALTVAPFLPLAESTNNLGFVTIDPDADGILRRSHILGNEGIETYPQLALSLALSQLKNDFPPPITVSKHENKVLIQSGESPLRTIDLVDNSMLINWSLGRKINNQPPHLHIGARSVAKVWQERHRLDKLDSTELGLKVKWLSLGQAIVDPNIEELYWSFTDTSGQLDELYAKRIATERSNYFNRLYEPNQPPRTTTLKTLFEQEQATEKQLFQIMDTLYVQLAKEPELFFGKPKDTNSVNPDYQDYLARVQEANDIATLIKQIPEERQLLEKNIADLEKELHDIVAGKICLIGSTATAAADFVPTPLAKRTPGVTIHANIYDTIMTGQFIRPAGPYLNTLIIVIAGMIVTLLAQRYNAKACGPLMIAVAVIYIILNTYVVLPKLHYNLVLTYPLYAMLAVFLVLTAYKELTEEKAKRQIRGMFSKALSESLVNELMRDPQVAALGGQNRELSCMFSDLAGFTPLSGGLGAHETVKLLNQYFDVVTEVVQTNHGGYINKFLGDGIFAMFGAPVTQPNHPEMAIRAAVEYIHAVDDLNARLNAKLSIRIGITTGFVMVGNCGSTTRMDYTAIGDSVNLSARLESGNKFFKTNILVEEETWRQAQLDKEMLARPMGAARITGVSHPVWTFNVKGHRSEHEDLVQAYADFGQAITLLYQEKYDEAIAILEDLHKQLPDDSPTAVYLEMAQLGQAGQDLPTDQEGAARFAGGVVKLIPPWHPDAHPKEDWSDS